VNFTLIGLLNRTVSLCAAYATASHPSLPDHVDLLHHVGTFRQIGNQ
jgi:hypothetical protein